MADKAARPEGCARAQAMWDQSLEGLRAIANGAVCLLPDEVRPLLDELLATCAPGIAAAVAGGQLYRQIAGCDRTDLTDRAIAVINDAVQAVQTMGATALSDSAMPLQPEDLSERRARRVEVAAMVRQRDGRAVEIAGTGVVLRSSTRLDALGSTVLIDNDGVQLGWDPHDRRAVVGQ